MVEGLVDPSEVQENLNFLERVKAYFTGDDEYKAAMLQNQKVMTKALVQQTGTGLNNTVTPSNVDITDLPQGLAGSSVEQIANGEKGTAMFDISGSKFEAQVRASADIEKNETVVIIGENNRAKPSPDSHDALSMLVGSGAAGRDTVMDPASYMVYESSDMEDSTDAGDVVLEPGDDKAIVSTGNVSPGAFTLGVGATDIEDVRYYLWVDEEFRVGGVTESPLGTMNNIFSFPDQFGAVIPATRKIEYRARYPSDAAGTVELTGRLHVQEL